MPESIRAVTWHAARAACLTVLLAPLASAQELVADPPPTPAFVTRYNFHITGAGLASDDDRFSWDTRWGGELDAFDYVSGRVTVLADYQALLGNQFQPFDPYQGNYTLAVSGSLRRGNSEIVGVFHHLSRHLSDRPKDETVAMNVALGRLLRRDHFSGFIVDSRVDIGRVVARAYIDYTWMTIGEVTARRPVSPRVEAFARVRGDSYAVDPSIAGRGRQNGGHIEGGVRLAGAAAILEVFGGYEQMIDADPIERGPQRWAFAGIRVLHE